MAISCNCMGGGSPEDDAVIRKERENKKIGQKIDKDIEKASRSRNRQHRCLLLGCGEAGKSTFIKQMRIMNNHPFEAEERNHYKQQMAVNIHSAINTLCEQMSAKEMDSLGKNPELLDAMDRVQELKTVSPATIFELADDIKALWESEEIQATYQRRNEFQIEECAHYFISKVHQCMEKSYVPTDQDMVQTRERTEGIVEHHFQMSSSSPVGLGQSKPQTVILIDVGGQRTERRKWIHCFEDVLILVFLAAVSEYDQVLEEDGRTNRLEESLHLFKTILESVYFKEQEIILFLNKKDLLEQKIKSGRTPFSKHFPTVNGQLDDGRERTMITKVFWDTWGNCFRNKMINNTKSMSYTLALLTPKTFPESMPMYKVSS